MTNYPGGMVGEVPAFNAANMEYVTRCAEMTANRCQCGSEQHEDENPDSRCESTDTRRIDMGFGERVVCRRCITDHRMPAVRGPAALVLARWEAAR